MSIHVPGPIAGLLDFLGMHLPEGDEDKLYARGEHYKQAASKAHGRVGELEHIKALVDRSLRGPAGEAALADIEHDLKNLRQEAANLEQLAAQCHECAEAIEHTKYVIIGMVAALAIQAGFAIFSGIGTLAELFAIMRTRLAVGAALRALLAKIAQNVTSKVILKALAREAAVGAGIGVAMDAGAQGVQMAQGHRDRLDLKSIGTNALEGAVAGGAGGIIGAKFHGLAGAAASGLGGAVAANATDAALQGNLDHVGDGLTGQTLIGAMSGFAGGVHGQLASDLRAREAGTGVLPDRAPGDKGASAGAHDGQNGANTKTPQAEDPHERSGGGEDTPQEGGATTKPAPENEHAQGQEGHEQQTQGQPQAAAQQAANPQAARAEGKHSAEQPQRPAQQSSASGGDRVEQRSAPTPPPGERAPSGPSLSGEGRTSAAPRADAPAARLSSAGSEPVREHHAGATATTRDAPAPVKHEQPAAARAGEPVKAFAEAAPHDEGRHAATNAERSLGDASPVGHRPDAGGVIGREHAPGDPNGERALAPKDQAGFTTGHLIDLAGERGPHVGGGDHLPGAGLGDDVPLRQHLRDVLDGVSPLHEGDWPSERARERIEKMWGGLNDAEKHALFKAAPMIGEHARLPVPECDHRARLAARELRDELLDYKRAVGWSERLQARLDALDNILKSVEPKPFGPRRYLLGFEHDGRNIMSVGNPDRAARTLVFVPGTFSGHMKLNHSLGEAAGFVKRILGLPDKTDVAGYSNISERFWRSMRQAAGHEDVAVVCWQNYHAPQSLGLAGAARSHYAVDAADRLRSHAERLAATNPRPDSATTIAGHSYGNTPVGHAAMHPDGLHADGILALSSPGMAVKDITGLTLKGQSLEPGDARFHSIIHENDVLIPACRAGLDLGDFGHNRMPHTEAFGAAPEQNHIIRYKDAPYSVFNFDGHRSPFDENRQALKLIGQIAVETTPIHFPQKIDAPHAPGFEGHPQLHDDLAAALAAHNGMLEHGEHHGENAATKAVAVLPEHEHAEKTNQLVKDLEAKGYTVTRDSEHWMPGTKHREIELIDTKTGEKVLLEVNTRMGLDSIAQADELAQLSERPGTDPNEAARLRRLSKDVYAAIVEPGRSAA